MDVLKNIERAKKLKRRADEDKEGRECQTRDSRPTLKDLSGGSDKVKRTEKGRPDKRNPSARRIECQANPFSISNNGRRGGCLKGRMGDVAMCEIRQRRKRAEEREKGVWVPAFVGLCVPVMPIIQSRVSFVFVGCLVSPFFVPRSLFMLCCTRRRFRVRNTALVRAVPNRCPL